MEGSHIVTRQNTATTRQEQTSATTNIRYQAPRPKLSNMLNSIESGIEATAPGTFLTRAQMDRISQRKIYFPSAIQAEHTFGTKIMDKLNELWNADYIDWYEEETPSLRKKAVRATVGKAKKIIETFSVPAGWAIRQIESKQTLLEGTFSLMNDILNDNGAGRKMVESLEKGDFAYTDQTLDKAKGQILDTAEKTVNKATGLKLTRFPSNIDEATSKAMAPIERKSEDLAIKYVNSKLNADEAKTELKQYIIQSVPDEFVQSWNLLKD